MKTQRMDTTVRGDGAEETVRAGIWDVRGELCGAALVAVLSGRDLGAEQWLTALPSLRRRVFSELK